MKLKVKLFIIFLFLFSTLSALIGFFSYYTANNIIINNYTTKVSENLNYVHDITQQRVLSLYDTVNYITNSEAVENRLSSTFDTLSPLEQVSADAQLSEFISYFVSFDLFSSINNIYLFNLNGVDYFSGIGFISEYHKNEYRKMAINTAFDTDNKLHYVQMQSTFEFALNSNENLRFFKPIYQDGKLYAYFFIDVDSTYFFELINTDNLEADTAIYIVDEQNNILQSNKDNFIGTTFSYPSENSIIQERAIDNFNWRLISITPSNIITKDSNLILNQTLMLTAVFIILAGFSIFLLTNRITAPINKLMRGIEKVRSGNLDVKVKKTTNDEIGDMTETFNIMVSDLNLLVEQRIEYIKEVNDAQYKVLQSQINPHFIYNTLNTVKFMAQVQNAHNISNTVGLISDLLRLSSHTTGQFVPLKQELLIVETYVKIQQIRYNYKFKFNIDMPAECTQIIVPKFIIQPIAENAIFHGIEPKKGLGILNIECRLENDVLKVSVSDNGIGMSEQKIQRILSDKTIETDGLNGIGLPNVNNRLILLFGEDYSLKIKSVENEGTQMSISIPKQSELNSEASKKFNE